MSSLGAAQVRVVGDAGQVGRSAGWQCQEVKMTDEPVRSTSAHPRGAGVRSWRMRSWRRRAGGVVMAVLFLGAFGTAGRPAAADAPSKAGVVLFGAAVGSRSGQTTQQAIASLEGQLGRTLDLHRTYYRWDDPEPASVVLDDVAQDRVPLISILPKKKDGTIIPWADVASGSQDAVIGAQADGLRSLGSRVILILHHEADISPGYGTAADYVAAYRHYVTVFRAHQASNVEFGTAFTAYTYATTIASWYPGNDVVDWIGADVYNSASCTPGKTGWRSLASAASAFYNWGSTHNKPLMLAEWGSAEDPADPNRKAQWLADATTTLQNWPNIQAVSYFDADGSCPDWWVDSSDAAFTAFSTLASYPMAHGKPSARLTPSANVFPASTPVHFSGAGSTGRHDTTGTGVMSWSLDYGDGSAPVSGTGQPPDDISHLYRAGDWTAALTVTDGYGLTSTAHTSVTAAAAPTVNEGSVTWQGDTSVTLPAWIDSNGLPASYFVRWGTSTAYGSISPTQTLPAKTYAQAVTYTLSGLAPATRYHWSYVATSAAGTTPGKDVYFDTPGPPLVVAQPASSVRSSTATLNGTVNPEALPTTYWWQWGTNPGYGQTSASAAVPTGNWAHGLSLAISGLTPITTYHARLVAQNSAGTTYGDDVVFTTTGSSTRY
jgi:hypothetical protein